MTKARRQIWVFLCTVGAAILPFAAHATSKTSSTTTTTTTETKEDGTKVTKRTRYRAGQSLNFDSQLIQGGVKRPETSVVTGNRDEVTDGLLSLREDFLDHAQADAGVEGQ